MADPRELAPDPPKLPGNVPWAGDYDPDIFDAVPIKYALSRIANRRYAAKARLAKKKHLGSAA